MVCRDTDLERNESPETVHGYYGRKGCFLVLVLRGSRVKVELALIGFCVYGNIESAVVWLVGRVRRELAELGLVVRSLVRFTNQTRDRALEPMCHSIKHFQSNEKTPRIF